MDGVPHNTDPSMRARLAARVLRAFGSEAILVAPGEKDMFDGGPTRCKDINQAIVLTLDDPVPGGDGVELVVRTAQACPEGITIVGMGCWTNIARAFRRTSDLSRHVKRLVLMGGQVRPPGHESNIFCDPVAAAFVLDLPVPKLIVPLEVARLCRYPLGHHAELIRAGNPRAKLVHDFIRAWQLGRHGGDPTAEPVLFDPLTVAMIFDQTLVRKTRSVRLWVEHRKGEDLWWTAPADSGAPNCEVVTETDTDRFERLFAERIVR